MTDKQRPRVGVGVVVIKNNRILLGKRRGTHGDGSWSLPGGHLEFGEDVEACAARELTEETGLTPLSLQLGPWTSDVMEDKHYISLFVFVHDFEGKLQLLEPHKCEGWEWFESDALPSPLFPPFQSLLRKIGLDQLVKISNHALLV